MKVYNIFLVYRNRGSGLKGDVGKWVLEDLEACRQVTRIRYNRIYWFGLVAVCCVVLWLAIFLFNRVFNYRLQNEEELASEILQFGEQVGSLH
jgi:hypothetical protein